jgi:hypothetical protein
MDKFLWWAVAQELRLAEVAARQDKGWAKSCPDLLLPVRLCESRSRWLVQFGTGNGPGGGPGRTS